MGRIDDSILDIGNMEDGAERALQLAGLVSTLFKIRGVVLVITGQLAFDIYANAPSSKPELELAVLSGALTPRLMLEIMRGQLRCKGSIGQWMLAGIPIRFQAEAAILHPKLCRDFMTEHGVAKLLPAEEITAGYILASVYPEPDPEAHTRARLLLLNGLMEAFQMDWTLLQNLCHQPDYRVGEELAQMRAATKKDIDVLGPGTDVTAQPATLSQTVTVAAKPKPRDAASSDFLSTTGIDLDSLR